MSSSGVPSSTAVSSSSTTAATTGGGGGQQQRMRIQKSMIQPIEIIYNFLKSKTKVQIWLFEQPNIRLEGKLSGFDEYMNIVLDEAEELNMKTKQRTPLGRLLLKGDNITSIQTAPAPSTTTTSTTTTATTMSSSSNI